MASVYKARWNKAKSLALRLQERIDEATEEFGKKPILMWDGEACDGEV